jgi:hypothetical protein
MRRYLIAFACAAVVAAGTAGYFFVLPAFAAGPKLNGNWKITFYQPAGQEMTVWLLRIETREGELTGKVLSAVRDELRAAKPTKMEATDQQLRFTMRVQQGGDTVEVPVVMYFPEKEANPKAMRGTMTLFAQRLFARMERTEDKEVETETGNEQAPDPLMMKAVRTRNAEAQAKLYAEVIETNADKPLAYFGGLGLLRALAKQGKPADELRKTAEAALQVAAAYGPDIKKTAIADIAGALSSDPKSAPLAVEYARQAEKNLTGDDPPEMAVAVLKTLATVLRKSDKADEAAQLQGRIDKLEEVLDDEFLKASVPFKPKAFGGRAPGENRTVLVELFTGVQCPPCVAADVAFDALLRTYRPADVVLIQYHLHVPDSDPLTNPDSESRSSYYDVGGTPMYYLNGQEGPQTGGPRDAGKQAYARLFTKLGDDLKTETKTTIRVRAERKGDKISIATDISGLDTTGEKVRLRLALVEEIVRYQGRNGQRLHHHVVRVFPGGTDGVKLDKAASRHEQTIEVAELTKSLTDYLTTYNKKRPFMDDERPLNLKHLKVIAFIQNDEDRKVIQAAQADVEVAK